MTSSLRSVCDAAGAPATRWNSSCAATAPSRAIGWRTVVRAGVTKRASWMSSHPVTAMSNTVHNDTANHRFTLDVDGHIAFSQYRLSPGVITFVHTEVPKQLGGRGISSELARGALEQVRTLGLKVVALCPFIAAFIAKHPEFNDLLQH